MANSKKKFPAVFTAIASAALLGGTAIAQDGFHYNPDERGPTREEMLERIGPRFIQEARSLYDVEVLSNQQLRDYITCKDRQAFLVAASRESEQRTGERIEFDHRAFLSNCVHRLSVKNSI